MIQKTNYGSGTIELVLRDKNGNIKEERIIKINKEELL